jgi:hypothetical protein
VRNSSRTPSDRWFARVVAKWSRSAASSARWSNSTSGAIAVPATAGFVFRSHRREAALPGALGHPRLARDPHVVARVESGSSDRQQRFRMSAPTGEPDQHPHRAILTLRRQ